MLQGLLLLYSVTVLTLRIQNHTFKASDQFPMLELTPHKPENFRVRGHLRLQSYIRIRSMMAITKWHYIYLQTRKHERFHLTSFDGSSFRKPHLGISSSSKLFEWTVSQSSFFGCLNCTCPAAAVCHCRVAYPRVCGLWAGSSMPFLLDFRT